MCNVRGINCLSKQKEVKKIINMRSLGLISLIEVKVKAKNMGRMYQNMFAGSCFCSNSSRHPGGRVIIAWNPLSFQVDIKRLSAYLTHCFVKPINKEGLFCLLSMHTISLLRKINFGRI